MMRFKFLYQYFVRPYLWRWIFGLILVITFSISFILLPAFSGWFLTICAIVFATGNTTFSYLFPAGIIRLLALFRTGTRYVEKTKNHETVLKVQDQLRLDLFEKLGKTSYFDQQTENHSDRIQHTVHGMDKITNHILLWFLPFCGFVISLVFSFFYLKSQSASASVYFLLISFALIIFVPKLFLMNYRNLHQKLQVQKLEIQHHLLQVFEARIELMQYKMEENILNKIHFENNKIHQIQKKLDQKGIFVQHIMGILMGLIGIGLTYYLHLQNQKVEHVVAIFLLMITLAEMAENIWINRANNFQFELQIKEVEKMFSSPEILQQDFVNNESFNRLEINNWSAKIPENNLSFPSLNFSLEKGKWLAILGETGVGKTTLLNSLFYSEYQQNGVLKWNGKEQNYLENSQAIYVTQQAYILSGTLIDNFIGYSENDIIDVLKIVDLYSWFEKLSDGFLTYLGENGEYMSGGQRKKLLLAQALLKKTYLLVIDEPTAGIDLKSTQQILSSIRKEFSQLSIIFVTHQKELTKLVDQVIEL